jgi:colanic acid biosynthesis glycosyl transferase WcaI
LRSQRQKDGNRCLFLHDFGGYPFTIQLARELAARGHRTNYAYYLNLPGPRGNVASDEAQDGLQVHGVKTIRDFQKYNYVKRVVQECEYGLRVASRVVRARPATVLSANTPPIAQFWITLAARIVRANGVVWVQDVFGIASTAILSSKMGFLGSLAASVVKKVDRLNLALCNSIVAISPSFSHALAASGVDEAKITTLANWAPLKDIPSFREKPNLWGKEHGLDGKFCFMYTGALGDKHDPSPLLHLAKYCGGRDSACVVVVSEGPGAEFLKKEATSLGLESLVILPYQPFEIVPTMMAEADVLLATLAKGASSFSVPSKVLSYLCAGRPIVCLMDRNNDAAQMVVSAGAGIVIDPPDVQAFIDACAFLMNNEEQRRSMGRQGRLFAEDEFDIERIAEQFERLVLMPSQPPAGARRVPPRSR